MLAVHILIHILALLSPEEKLHSVYHRGPGSAHVFHFGPARAVALQSAVRPKGFNLTLQIQLGDSTPHNLGEAPVGLAFGIPEQFIARRIRQPKPGQETFSVDGVAPGDPKPENARLMFHQPLLDYTGMFIPASGILCDAHGRVQVSTGSRLRYNGRLLAQRLQKERDIARLLGKPDFCSFWPSGGIDAPTIRHYYYRENYLVETDVINDAYIQKRLPAAFHKVFSGRICRFRVSSYCEPLPLEP
jgi:hypothetical protein